MNLLLLEPNDLLAGGHRARINGRRLRHVRDIHRAASGDRLRVGLVNGLMGEATVVRLDDETLELDVRLKESPPPPLPVTVLLALPRPKSLKRALQGLTAMGVKSIYLVNSCRVEKSYWQTPLLRPQALRAQLLLGLEQGRDTLVPRVELRRLFKPFVEDEVAAIAGTSLRLVAHPEAERDCPRGLQQPATVAVGPEGGFVQYEIDLLVKHGFEAVALGPRRLRVEQAMAALLGRLF
jgi:RsmE family RNA methyltransferase